MIERLRVFMKAYVGTSGFAYDFWKGDFYPEKISSAQMLEFYGGQFNTVELNNTFYRMPKTEVVQRWADAVPADFRFVIKASRRITHVARLGDTDDSVEYLFSKLEPLGDRLGAVLFQCPPNLRKDLPRLEGFLARLPQGARCVLEFRHDSWFSDDVYAALRKSEVALCIGDYEGAKSNVIKGGQTPIVATASYGYLRLREEDYDEPGLRKWVDTIQGKWDEAYVFFKHEETAPTNVRRMHSALNGSN